jgi:hypothetical protein
VTKYKTYITFLSLFIIQIICSIVRERQNNKNGISFLSLFIIHIIYSIVWQNTKQQKWYIISLTLHYTNYLFYCERNTKTYKYYNHFSHSLLYKLFILLWEKYKNIQILYYIVTNAPQWCHNSYKCETFGHSSHILLRRICLSSLNYFQWITILGKFGGRFSHILWEKCKIYKYWIPFLSLFIIHIISIVWQIQKHT